MNNLEFVDAIVEVVYKESIDSLNSNLTQPPGRKPSEKLVLLSNWFNNLSASDKTMVKEIIKESANYSVFSFLCVLDGVRSIEGGQDTGKLELFYVKDTERILLNSNHGDSLHDLFVAND